MSKNYNKGCGTKKKQLATDAIFFNVAQNIQKKFKTRRFPVQERSPVIVSEERCRFNQFAIEYFKGKVCLHHNRVKIMHHIY